MYLRAVQSKWKHWTIYGDEACSKPQYIWSYVEDAIVKFSFTESAQTYVWFISNLAEFSSIGIHKLSVMNQLKELFPMQGAMKANKAH